MQRGLLPLFPLQVVLLPGAQLPLHIFEDRYKELVGHVRRENVEFGVVLASDKGILNAGCTAAISQILHEYPDGRLDIITVGRRRFEIRHLNDDLAFLQGEVDYFDDDDFVPPAASVMQRAIDGYNAMQALSSNAPLDPDRAEDRQLSFKLAEPVSELNFRQELLTLRSEAERLRHLADYFPGFLKRQKRVQHIKDLAPRNGHAHGGLEV